MKQILQSLEGIICYLDDILIPGKDEAQHLEHLEAVLSHLEMWRLKPKEMPRLKITKSVFCSPKISIIEPKSGFFQIDLFAMHALSCKAL